MTGEKDFIEELNIFRNEVDSALRFLYTESAIHHIASKNKKILNALNQSPLFWNTILGSLQLSVFMTLGRIFDTDSENHTLSTLFKSAQNNKNLFSKESFEKRWNKDSDKKGIKSWLPEYLKKLYVPTDQDFRNLRKFIGEQRKIYEDIYRPIRHHFGHRKYTNNEEVQLLFSKIKIRELEKHCIILKSIHETFWQLYHNGRGPLTPIKHGRYSTVNILNKRLKPYISKPLNIQMVEETEYVLEVLKSGMNIPFKK